MDVVRVLVQLSCCEFSLVAIPATQLSGALASVQSRLATVSVVFAGAKARTAPSECLAHLHGATGLLNWPHLCVQWCHSTSALNEINTMVCLARSIVTQTQSVPEMVIV